MTITNIQQSLNQMKIALPNAPEPVGNYKATIISGRFLTISGQLPIKNGCILYKGKLGSELSTDEGKKAAKLCALNILSHATGIGQNHTIKQLIKIEGYINSTSDFTEHALVLDGASDFLSQILKEKSGHTRSAIGCNSLPLGAAVEIVATLELE